jgi:hypothetical protein
MSNEIQCNFLGYGPIEPHSNFVSGFKRADFLADVPIAGRKQDDRGQRTEAHGTRFIYPRPGVRWQEARESQETVEDIEREGYEGYVPPKIGTGDQALFSLTFTCPSDPPSLWAMEVIEKYYAHGMRFMFRWWDLDNYWRCIQCNALDGICTRVGAFWSVAAGSVPARPGFKHVASWYGRNPCKCQAKTDRRAMWDGSNDNLDYDPEHEICSITAMHEGDNNIRIVSTGITGVRHMTRQHYIGPNADQAVIDMNRDRMSWPTIEEQEGQ